MRHIAAVLRDRGVAPAVDEASWTAQSRLRRCLPLRRLRFGSHSFWFDIRTAGGPGVWHWLAHTQSEQEAFHTLERLCHDSRTVFDVGAWVGTHSLVMARTMHRGRVYAFEPDPAARMSLKRHVRLNSANNVSVVPAAASSHTGCADLQAANGWGSSESSMVRFRSSVSCESAQTVSVDTVSLDDFCREHDLWPDGIKMDIEGAEALALEGANLLFDRAHPWLLLELHGDYMPNERAESLYGYLMSIAKTAVVIRADDISLIGGACPQARPAGIVQLLIQT
jgi:FkbM family methyltransferase